MVAQMRDVLDRYQAAGRPLQGERPVHLRRLPRLERPAEFTILVTDFLASAG